MRRLIVFIVGAGWVWSGHPSGKPLPKDSESALVQLAISSMDDVNVDEFGTP